MALLAMAVAVCGITLSAAAICLRRFREPPADAHGCGPIFRPPGLLVGFAVVGMAATSVGALVYAYTLLAQHASFGSIALVACSAIIAAFLSWMAALDARRTYVGICDGRLLSVSGFKKRDVALSEIVGLMTYQGHIAMKLRDGQAVLLSGVMGRNAQLRAYLRTVVSANKHSQGIRTGREN